MVSETDQLRVIFEILGDQSDQDFDFIKDKTTKKYAFDCQNGAERIQLLKEFPDTEPGVVEILQEMLQFNPQYRSDASFLLKNKIFDNIRDPTMEAGAPYKIKLDVDAPDQFDYEALLSLKYTYDDFQEMLENEVQLIK